MKLFLIVTLIAYSVDAAKHKYISSDLEPLTDEIINAINALNATWKADKNFNGSTSVRMDELVSPHQGLNSQDWPKKEYPPFNLSKNFDAREAWPNCTSIGKIYDQRKGFPSWIYTAVGTVADRLCIKTGVQIDVEATVEKIIKFNNFSNGYNSADIGQAFNYWSKNGIFTVESTTESSCLPLWPKCQSNEFKLNRYFKVVNEFTAIYSIIKLDIMLNGPISAYMQVYSDFPSYKSGLYTRSSEKVLGVHNIKLIGWGTENGVTYLLAANSWGTEWGEKGFFKIQQERGILGDIPSPISPSLVPIDIIKDIPKSYVHGQLFYLA